MKATILIPIIYLFYSGEKVSFNYSTQEVRELIIAIDSYPPDSITFREKTIVAKTGAEDNYKIKATAETLKSLVLELRGNEEMQKLKSKNEKLINTVENFGLNCSIR